MAGEDDGTGAGTGAGVTLEICDGPSPTAVESAAEGSRSGARARGEMSGADSGLRARLSKQGTSGLILRVDWMAVEQPAEPGG